MQVYESMLAEYQLSFSKRGKKMYFDPEDRKYLEYSEKLKGGQRGWKGKKEDRARWNRAEKYNGSYLKAQRSN